MSESSRPDASRPVEVHAPQRTPRTRKELAWLSVGALGVVYGDIGTSPLYAMKECFSERALHHADPADRASVLGVVSLVVWALLLVVLVKYLVVVLRADNKGEGGTLALLALVRQKLSRHREKIAIPILLALFGTGLLYGEGLITPAISVLSAVEGLSQQSPRLSHLVIPIAVVILVALFLVQRYGTGRIGAVFGWVMLAWFVAIGLGGLPHIMRHPEILAAVSPHYAVSYFLRHGTDAFFLLGSVVLCVTGAEALYADMGHFGRTPIRIAWSIVVFPGLLLNYLGQGALYLDAQTYLEHPFYALYGGGPFLVPMIVLATCAAVIASQALISGAFSLTNQAVQLGYLPRVTVIHTSHKHEGQIYIPEINHLFMIACVALVLAFQTSGRLAAAYGIAVTGLFLITGFLTMLVARRTWTWSFGLVIAIFVPFAIIDGALFSANVVKIAHGGWVPLVVAASMFAIMTTWWRGRTELSKKMEMAKLPEHLFLADIATAGLPRVPGTAVFMTSVTDGIPNVLLHHVKHNKVLHRQVVLLSLVTENVPFVVGNAALTVRELGHGLYRVVARVGFMQQPNVPRILARCDKRGLLVASADTTYYLGRETLLTTGTSGLARWRKKLFAFLARNSGAPSQFFKLPPNRVVELGVQIEL